MKALKHWVIDYLHMFKGQAKMIYHRRPPAHYLGHIVEGKQPVILIPGIIEKWGFMKNLGDKISLAGHPVYIVPSLGFNQKAIPSSAKLIREVVDENKLKNVVLVAHSKGGLIGKYVLIHHNQDHAVQGLVAVSAPFSGSNITRFFRHKSFAELSPQSRVVQELKSNQQVNSQIISIYPEFDNHVWAKEGSFLEGAENIKVPVKGHHKVLFNQEVQEQVLKSIAKLAKP